MLYRSNKLMYDRGTNTLWHQFLGEPAVGPLAESGVKLELIPVLVTTWGDWRSAHPDTTVLSIETGIFPPEEYQAEDDVRSIYFQYRQSPRTIFPVSRRSGLLPTKAEVLGLSAGGRFRAYPLKKLVEEPVINDSLGSQDVVVVTSAGGGARVYQRGSHRFSLAQAEEIRDGVPTVVDQQGRRWQAREDALVLTGDESQSLPRLPSHMAYWFGWYAFHPDTDVYGKGESSP